MDIPVTVTSVRRDLGDLNLFSSLGLPAPYLGSFTGSDGSLMLEFDGDLTDTDIHQVMRRISSTPETEPDEILLDENVEQLSALIPVTGTMSTAQLSDAVRLLGSAAGALHRLRNSGW